MAYIINKTNGEALLTLQDGTVDASTSVQLVGRNYVGYGEIQNENFLFLMENFANDAPPARPLAGQTWFDTVNNSLSVYCEYYIDANGNIVTADAEVEKTKKGRWTSLGNATISLEEPSEPGDGFLWFKEPYNTLYVWNGIEWVLIGPDAVEGFGKTRAESTTLVDENGESNPVILFWVNDSIVCIVSSRSFVLDSDINPIEGITEILDGFNVPGNKRIQGRLVGVSSAASKLETIRTINGVGFNGTENITIKAATTNPLTAGDYLLGGNFNGSSPISFSVNGTKDNVPDTVVVRDFNGDFSARNVTVNKLIGQVTAPAGTSSFDIVTANKFVGQQISGTASSAEKLLPGAAINGVTFDGSHDVDVPANAETLTGAYINNTVVGSSLQRLGTLEKLNVADAGISLGAAGQCSMSVQQSVVKFDVLNGPQLSFLDAESAMSSGGNYTPAMISRVLTNLGLPNYKFDNVYANVFHGEATSARFADLAENYLADKQYEPGTVLVFGGTNEVTTTGRFADHRVAGVVTTNPGFTMNTELTGDNVVCIALQGRVPCKVKGPVAKGDLLTTSPAAGYATVTKDPMVGTIIGKSLEDNSSTEFCVVEIAVGKM